MMDDNKVAAMQGNLEVLYTLLKNVTEQASEAYRCLEQGEQNQAIGSLVGTEEKLHRAQQLLGAVMALQESQYLPEY